MMKIIKKKLNSRTGESISETLISLLIAALALVMLAGAVSSSSGMIMKSKDKMNSYYSANEASNGVVKKTYGTGSTVTGGIIITDTSRVISDQSYNIEYFKNEEFGRTTVVAYNMPTS